MQGLVLAGGEGTRLRPLTTTIPKPSVPLVNRPLVTYLLQWMIHHGVDDIVMSCGFLADGLRASLGDGSQFGATFHYIDEPHPMGTAGAVKFAEDFLREQFVVVNGDVLVDYDLGAQIDFHNKHGAKATLALTEVQDVSGYGLVTAGDDGAVSAFIEKPNPDRAPAHPMINAGVYVLERSVLDLIPAGEMWSFEREVFPDLIGKGAYAFKADGYWIDLGTPERYLQATFDILERRMKSDVGDLLGDNYADVADDVQASAARIVPPAVVDTHCVLEPGAQVGSLVVLGHACHIGKGSVIERSVLHSGSRIGSNVTIHDSILAMGVEVGDDCVIEHGSVIGEGARIGARNILSNGSRIAPGVDIPDGALAF